MEVPVGRDILISAVGGNGEDGLDGGHGQDGSRGGNGSDATEAVDATVRKFLFERVRQYFPCIMAGILVCCFCLMSRAVVSWICSHAILNFT